MLLQGQVDNVLSGMVNLLTKAPVLEELEVNENGIYTPPEGVDGYNKVTVETPTFSTEEITITENGIYTPSEGKDGFSKVTANVIFQPIFNAVNVKVANGRAGNYGEYLHNQPMDVPLSESGDGYYMFSLNTVPPATEPAGYYRNTIKYLRVSDYVTTQRFLIPWYNDQGSSTNCYLEMSQDSLGCYDYSADKWTNLYVKISKLNIIETQMFGPDGSHS